MSKQLEPNEIAQAARSLLDERVQVVQDLARAQNEVARARDQLTEAERAEAGAWRAAQKAGWTRTELRKAGLKEPARRPAGRPQKSSAQTEA